MDQGPQPDGLEDLSAAESIEADEPDLFEPDDIPFTGDWTFLDGGEIEEGDFLAPCSTNTDCISGFCVQGPDGKFCTRQCLDEGDCPPEFQCVGIVLTYPDLTFLCVQKVGKLCSQCSADEDCILDGARCVELDDGKFCGQGCEAAPDDCPMGYECVPVDGGLDQCMPVSRNCSCTGEDPNVIRSCSVNWEDPDDPLAPTYTCTGIQNCEAGGWGPCQLPAEDCDGQDNDCNGQTDEGFFDPETGKYTGDENCGVCGNNCTFMQVPHGTGKCDADKAVPDCTSACDDGFFDVDGSSTNGCECQFLGDTDLPGLHDLGSACEADDCSDANCDGIDGEVDGGVFVAKYGDDANAGTIESPLLTIQAGIQGALDGGKRDVYVSTGVYTDPVSLRADVGVYGGYSADFTIREPVAYETVVLGGPPSAQSRGAVNAQGIAGGAPGTTIFSGFVVFGYNNKDQGGNSYAVYVRDCDASLAIRDCHVLGGDGGDGLQGDAGGSGDDGADGQVGAKAKETGHANCKEIDHNHGGAGGSNACGDNDQDVGGGPGGDAVCPDFDESLPDDPECGLDSGSQAITAQENGSPGLNNEGEAGSGGTAGKDGLISGYLSSIFGCVGNPSNNNCWTCRVPGESMSGTDGSNGSAGGDGESGPACDSASGKVVNGEWQMASAGTGEAGAHGGGGGGGGAAGGVETIGCASSDRKHTDVGGSGGGGGSGGCGATGGTGGGSGGGSFALFVTFTQAPASVPEIADTVVEPGRGGDGGNGGPGGVGGSGGAGASGGTDAADQSETFCTSGGGHGGSGGSGGHGGGGGGGCGGPAYGLFVHGADGGLTADYLSSGLTYLGSGTGGTGGMGGVSLGNDGLPGVDGMAEDSNL